MDAKFNKEAYNRLKYKGSRNKNNPANKLRRADEVLINKSPNYTDFLSGCLLLSDAEYKVYVKRDDIDAFRDMQGSIAPTEPSPNKGPSVKAPFVGPYRSPGPSKQAQAQMFY